MNPSVLQARMLNDLTRLGRNLVGELGVIYDENDYTEFSKKLIKIFFNKYLHFDKGGSRMKWNEFFALMGHLCLVPFNAP